MGKESKESRCREDAEVEKKGGRGEGRKDVDEVVRGQMESQKRVEEKDKMVGKVTELGKKKGNWLDGITKKKLEERRQLDKGEIVIQHVVMGQMIGGNQRG